MIKFAVTHVGTDGTRILSEHAQARNMYATHADATKRLGDILSANSRDKIASVFGPTAVKTFAIREVECWDNGGDPKGIFFSF